MKIKKFGLALALGTLALFAAGCGDPITGTVVGNGRSETACTADPSLPIAVSVETNEDYTQPDGNVGKVVKVVCLPEFEASQYPLGSAYPKK